MSDRCSVLDLSTRERRIAARLVAEISAQMPWERVEAVFRALARAEWLMLPRAPQRALPLAPTLLRNERIWATAIVLALHVELGEERAEAVIEALAQRGAALDVLLGMPQPRRANTEGRAVV